MNCPADVAIHVENALIDDSWMAQALREADAAAEAKDVPVGCVIVDASGRELARGRNRRERDQDPTAHAEMMALRAAAARLRTWHLDGATVYVTLEPCPMCAGALVNARIMRLVYGAADTKAGAIDSAFFIGNGAPLNHQFKVARGVLAEACAQRLRKFFEALRAAGEK